MGGGQLCVMEGICASWQGRCVSWWGNNASWCPITLFQYTQLPPQLPLWYTIIPPQCSTITPSWYTITLIVHNYPSLLHNYRCINTFLSRICMPKKIPKFQGFSRTKRWIYKLKIASSSICITRLLFWLHFVWLTAPPRIPIALFLPLCHQGGVEQNKKIQCILNCMLF